MASGAMTRAMDDVFYETRDFSQDMNMRYPTVIIEKHFVYHLDWDNEGCLVCMKDKNNNKITSPRKLREICIYKIVSKSKRLERMDPSLLPTNVYPVIMTEALLLRRMHIIEWCISTWPTKVIRLYDMIPLEDEIGNTYLTSPSEDSKISLVDAIVAGLLKRRDVSNLKYLDFTRFDRDKKLCKELCRLPVLWMKQKDRTVENLHDQMSKSIELTKDKTERFINRISTVYSNMDFPSGNKISQVTILVDLAVTVDDVPMGLSLQHCSPFKIACGRLWVKPIDDVKLPLTNLSQLIDCGRITHFEYEDHQLPENDAQMDALIEALRSLKNLFALSLPNSVDAVANRDQVAKLNGALLDLKHISRLDLSYCNLRSHLSLLLGGTRAHMSYLNLKDCRLVEEDMFFLQSWRSLSTLRELNLSSNNLSNMDEVLFRIVEKMKRIVCFSVSFCSLSIHSQVLLTRMCKECSKLKFICMQGFVPLPEGDVLELLRIFAQIKRIQKVVLFPEIYAFPGLNEYERTENKYRMLKLAYTYLEMRDRYDIELE